MNENDFIPIRSVQSRALADHLDALHGSPRKLNDINNKVQNLTDEIETLAKGVKFSNQEWLTREEAATLIGVSVDSIDRRRKDGSLKSHQVDGTSAIRFKRSDVEALMI